MHFKELFILCIDQTRKSVKNQFIQRMKKWSKVNLSQFCRAKIYKTMDFFLWDNFILFPMLMNATQVTYSLYFIRYFQCLTNVFPCHHWLNSGNNLGLPLFKSLCVVQKYVFAHAHHFDQLGVIDCCFLCCLLTSQFFAVVQNR